MMQRLWEGGLNMGENTLLDALNWFLLLEKGQVEFYHHLSQATDDAELCHGLQRFKKVEEEHVKVIAAKINILELDQSRIKKALGAVASAGLPVFGQIVGRVSNLAGMANMLKAGYLTEKLAIRDYRKLINAVDDAEIRDMLWSNLIDEESHCLWLYKKAKELKKQRLKT